ncbi:MAG: fasciclin domain-containing protein [Acidobacteriota bacterium]
MPNIVETATASDSFKTLITAVKAADLVEMLSGPGPFTFFAPNDEAFAKLPGAAIEELLKNTSRLKRVLSYHIVAGKMMGADVAKIGTAKTLEGQSVGIASNNGVKINDAKVIETDIACDNGVIHVLDTVLTLPTVKSTAR